MADPSDFGVVRRLTITSAPGAGRHEARRATAGPAGRATGRTSVLDVDRILVGARYFGFPPSVHGFLDGDILQVLLYDRVLDEAERTRGRGVSRRAGSAATGRSSGPRARASASRWSPVQNPPPVQMLVAGLLGPRAAGRPDEHQQRPVSPRRQARRPGLRRQHLPALRPRRRRRRGDGRALLGEQGEPRRPDRHGADAAGLSRGARASSSRPRGRSR